MNITKEEMKMFGDRKGNINVLSLLHYRLAEDKGKLNDKYMREGRWDLVEWP